jgi:predicted phosphodiesterase
MSKHKDNKTRWLFWIVVTLFLGVWFWGPSMNGGHLPENAELTVVHLTDLHLDTRGKITHTPWTHKIAVGGYRLHRPCTGRAFECLDQAVSQIRDTINPDVVVITGDVVNRGDDIEALRRGVSILSRLQCPVVVAQGDHDIPRQKENSTVWNDLFGAPHGCTVVNDTRFFFLPFAKNEAAFADILQSIRTVSDRNKIHFLCLHRMLWAPRLMEALARRHHGCSVLDPDREKIVEAMDTPGARWVVLCGHSHTDHCRRRENITQLCAPSLAEHPHAFRVIKIKDGQVFYKLVRLDRGVTK